MISGSHIDKAARERLWQMLLLVINCCAFLKSHNLLYCKRKYAYKFYILYLVVNVYNCILNGAFIFSVNGEYYLQLELVF